MTVGNVSPLIALNEEKKQKWLDQWREDKPGLYKESRVPIQEIQVIYNKDAWQRWSVLEQGPVVFPRILNESFQEWIVAFDHHYVGYIGVEIEGEGELLLEPAEVPAELGDSWDQYPARFDNGFVPQRDWFGHKIVLSSGIYHHPRRFALQYLRLRWISGKLIIARLWMTVQTSMITENKCPLKKKDIPEQELIQKIDRVASWTLRECLQYVIEDGPKRDRRLWLGDLRLAALSIYSLNLSSSIVRSACYLFAAMLREDGSLPACIYTDMEGGNPHIGDEMIPDYAFLYGDILATYYEITKDRKVLIDLLPVAIQQFRILVEPYLDQQNVLRLPSQFWCFVDWNPELDRLVAEHAIALYGLKRILPYIHSLFPEWEEWGSSLLKKLKFGVQSLWDSRLGLFRLESRKQISMASQIWGVLSGILPLNLAKTVMERVKTEKDMIPIRTPYLMHHYVEALCKCEMFSQAREIIMGFWGEMIRYGATTFWEVFSLHDPWFSPYKSHLFNSYCHVWSTTPIWYFRHPVYGAQLFCEESSA